MNSVQRLTELLKESGYNMKKWSIVPYTKVLENNGVHAVYNLNNGYRISIIQCAFSYGGENAQWELAILNNITGYIDVIGYLDDKQLLKTINKILTT